jgi:hypothetical protein
LKRSKTEPFIVDDKAPWASEYKPVIHPGKNFAEMFQMEGKKELKEKADQALIIFIICCGIPPHVLNRKYMQPSQTTFEDSLVPSYAATLRVLVINHLRECWDNAFF